jgi:hypothetical protein
VELITDWKHKCELKLLVCQPNPLRPDRVTIGFVLRDTNPDSPRVEVRLADKLRAVRCICPDADLEAIEGTLIGLSLVLKNITDFESYLQNLPADFPSDIALLSGGAVLTDSMDAEAELFEKHYLLPMAPGNGAGKSLADNETGRPYILRKMQEAFRNVGAWNFIAKEIPIDKYTFKSDPLKIDFNYTKRETSQQALAACRIRRQRLRQS